MAYIEGYDTVRGTDVTITMQIDDEVFDLYKATNFESSADITLDSVPRIGNRTVAHKISNIEITGSMTVYYGDPEVRRVFISYVNSGKWPDITVTVRNEDKDSGVGAQTVIYKHVKFNSIPLASFDAETTSLQEDIEFYADEILIPEEFNHLPGERLN